MIRTAVYLTILAACLSLCPPALAATEESPPPAPPSAEEAKPPETTTGEKKPAAEKGREPRVLHRFDIAWEKGDALLSDVKDNTFGYDEEAFFWVLYKVTKTPPEILKPDEEMMRYSTLLAMPSSHRGHLVTLRGVYLSAAPIRMPVLALQRAIPMFYECNVREEPANQVRPLATVIVIDDPMQYLQAEDSVRVTGYFYKIRQYEGNKGIGFAPMIIAQRLEPETGPVAPVSGGASALPYSDQMRLGVMFAVLAALVIGFFFVRQYIRPKSHATSKPQVHKFRLRRPDRVEPPGGGGPGGEGGGQKP